METPPETTSSEDEDLLSRMARGDQEGLAAFYDRHANTLMAVAVRILGDAATAEDVLQEVFVQIWDKASTYQSDLGKPLGWAVVMTRNKAIDRLRARTRGQRLMERAAVNIDPPDAPSPDETEPDRAEYLQNALAQLPAEQRAVIELAFYHGMSQTEIAARLQQPLGTIKARIRRGMLRMREKLQPIL